jgi:hypothetical protein
MARDAIPYNPTQEKIREECLKLQENWNEEDHIKRRYHRNNYGQGKGRGNHGNAFVPEPLTIPEVKTTISRDHIYEE